MTTECRKCHGTGEFLNGTCWDCGGTGTHKEIRYQTTKASESKHPAMRAERELKEDPFIPPNPDHVQAKLLEMKAMLEIPDIEEEYKEEIKQWQCEHEFPEKGEHAITCKHCGIHRHQWWYSINAPLEVRLSGEA